MKRNLVLVIWTLFVLKGSEFEAAMKAAVRKVLKNSRVLCEKSPEG
jgi:hypothetical protein